MMMPIDTRVRPNEPVFVVLQLEPKALMLPQFLFDEALDHQMRGVYSDAQAARLKWLRESQNG